MESPATSTFVQVLLHRRSSHSRLLSFAVRKCCVRRATGTSAVFSSRSVSSSGRVVRKDDGATERGGREMPSPTSGEDTDPQTKDRATRLVSVDLRSDDEDVGKTTTIQRRNAQYDVDFGNHSEAFRRKTTGEIVRALCVLKMCGIDSFVNNSLTLFKWTKRVLGRPGLKLLVKPTFFRQFVGGETHKEIQECMARLWDAGIRPMLAATMEEDVGDPEKSNEIYNSNCSRILECMDLATAEATPSPMMQVKITGITSADLVVKLGKIYDECDDKLHLITELSKCLTDDNAESKLEELFKDLDEKDLFTLKNTVKRLKRIAEEAVSRGIKILVDAEYTYMNSGLSLLTLSMQAVYNRNIPVIWNTYQCYLKDAYRKVCEELSLTDSLGVYFGAKLVRGAYVQQERTRAEALQQPCIVCDNYEATNKTYNKVLEFLLNQTTRERWKCSFIIATHNEQSIKLAIEKMKELGIDRQRDGVSFGQLYGMSDDITYPLAFSGYAVYKSIPYGTLDEVLPYLVRRAIENKAVLSGLRNEKSLLWKEMKQRLSKSRFRRSNR